MLNYEGLFFSGDSFKKIQELDIKRLPFINDEIHCTFKYKPNNDEIFNDIVGKEFKVTLIGYGSDGNNSGFEISLPDELIPYYINIDENTLKLKVPHITSSLNVGAKAKNTQYLKFEEIEEKIEIVGKFGYWIKDERGEYLSYLPYEKK